VIHVAGLYICRKKEEANVQTCFIDPVDDPCVVGGGTRGGCPAVVG